MKKKKNELRAHYLRRRNRLSPAVLTRKSGKISNAILRLDAVQKAQNIFAYIAHHTEVRTLSLLKKLQARGKKIFAPKVNPQRRKLEFYEIRDFRRDLKRGAYGIFEPAGCMKRHVPQKGDVVLVPGAAFDHQGYRVGYGKGCYDHFLHNAPKGVVTIGLCYDSLLVHELPGESHDRRVRFVATEEGIYEMQKRDVKKIRRKRSGIKNGRRKKHTKRAA